MQPRRLPLSSVYRARFDLPQVESSARCTDDARACVYIYRRVTKPMRYLTFTAPSSSEVRKAILRHHTDVLQIAAIYSATGEGTAPPGRIIESVEFSFYRAGV